MLHCNQIRALQKRFHFDNIMISRYDQVHGRNSFQRDKTKGLEKDRLELATVDVGAIIDFASSFGKNRLSAQLEI